MLLDVYGSRAIYKTQTKEVCSQIIISEETNKGIIGDKVKKHLKKIKIVYYYESCIRLLLLQE